MTDSPASFSRPGFLAKSGLALIKRLSGASPSRLNLALQGGGAHGAFTWGVLDALLEDTRIEFEGLSGGSAGAMNSVVLADGWMKGGRDGARPAQFLPQHRPRHAGLDPLVRLGQVDRAHRERARARGRLRVHGRVTGPHAPSLRVLAAPEGAVGRLGAARRRPGPHAPSLRVLAAPRGGCRPPWGGPASAWPPRPVTAQAVPACRDSLHDFSQGSNRPFFDADLPGGATHRIKGLRVCFFLCKKASYAYLERASSYLINSDSPEVRFVQYQRSDCQCVC